MVRMRNLAIPLGPLLGLIAFALTPALAPEARATVGVAACMALWWMSEAIPLEATALVPLVAFPVLGVSTAKQAAAPYADETIFLFMGGLFLSLAMERWGLHRRLAMVALSIFGARPSRVVLGLLTASAGLSMWTSNTATTAMMLPIATSLVASIVGGHGGGGGDLARPARRFATCAMLAIAYGSTIGGVGTLIGTPPNAFMASHLRSLGVEAGFARWMIVSVPMAVVFVPLTWLVLTRVVLAFADADLPDLSESLARERAAMPRPSRGEWAVFVVFLLTALAWIFRVPVADALGLVRVAPDGVRTVMLTDASIAIAASIALFVIPVDARRRVFVLDWETGSRLPWGVLVLFGGGLSLADAIARTGVDDAIASGFDSLRGVPTWVLVAALAGIVIFLTELVSNTAIAQTFIPVASALAISLGLSPEVLVVPVALAASYAFMLPMGTPPNALVFASGRVRIAEMARAGMVLNLAGVAAITLTTLVLVPRAFGR